MATIDRTATAVWEGTGKDGKGTLTTGSDTLSATPFSFDMRFGDQAGTNPEELIAAAHAGCFSMALAFALQNAGFTARRIETAAVVSLAKDGAGFRITRSALILVAAVPGIDRAQFEEIAGGAKANCPVSKLFNAEISLDWSLDG